MPVALAVLLQDLAVLPVEPVVVAEEAAADLQQRPIFPIQTNLVTLCSIRSARDDQAAEVAQVQLADLLQDLAALRVLAVQDETADFLQEFLAVLVAQVRVALVAVQAFRVLPAVLAIESPLLAGSTTEMEASTRSSSIRLAEWFKSKQSDWTMAV